uniref:Uncharacterized protein n=1 Tax=Cannabis sativa TaxID=3483 RepID=A0A803NU69_CANSA
MPQEIGQTNHEHYPPELRQSKAFWEPCLSHFFCKGQHRMKFEMGFLYYSISLNAHKRLSWSIPPGNVGLV